jgi:hypothetical protein
MQAAAPRYGSPRPLDGSPARMSHAGARFLSWRLPVSDRLPIRSQGRASGGQLCQSEKRHNGHRIPPALAAIITATGESFRPFPLSPSSRRSRRLITFPLYHLPAMLSPSFRIESFYGTAAGWAPVSPAVVTAATAARRLALYRAVRGDARIFRAAPVIMPGESPAALPRPVATGAALPSFL